MSRPRIVIGTVTDETDTTVTIATPDGSLTAFKGTETQPIVLIVDGTAVSL